MKNLGAHQSEPEPIELASRDEIEALQLKRLQWSLNHAYANVVMYKTRFDEHGVHPDDLQNVQDLAKFPLTVKSDLRDHYPFGLFAVPRERIRRLHASSGTTGKPVIVGYTDNDCDLFADMVARSLRASGVHPGDLVHNAYGYGLFTGGLGAHMGIERLGATVVPVSGGMTRRQVTLINDLKPQAIMMTPSYALNILDEFHEQGLNSRDSSLEVGIFGAEPWTNALREKIEQAFDMHAVDIYGLSEILGPGVANECVETKDGLHIWEDHFYPEIIDPRTGEPLEDGQKGELVLTTLTKEAMPMIRYRTGDLTRLLPGTARSMRRMERIAGRCDDMMILRGVNVFPTQIEEQLLTIEGLAPHFQITLHRSGRMDAMRIHVEAKPDAADEAGKATAARMLAQRIKQTIGLSTDIIVGNPGEVARSRGKAVRVIDRRGQDRVEGDRPV
ncbi:MAG: phenylacetate--CoA ligase PaaK [Hyphomicrobiales bacterium]